jgi:hypothetical protein
VGFNVTISTVATLKLSLPRRRNLPPLESIFNRQGEAVLSGKSHRFAFYL